MLLTINIPQSLAADTYTLKGYGYGHGIGLCQWGAKGRADSGQNYQQILESYFQGTHVTSRDDITKQIRVRLFGKSNLSKAQVEGEKLVPISFVKTDGTFVTDGTNVYRGMSGKWAVMPSTGGCLKLARPDGTIAVDNVASPVIVTGDTTGTASSLVVYNASGKRNHSYTGSIYIYSAGPSALYLVNYVDFEPNYLNGLGEMPSSWPYDALYSQAIAARSYAIACMKPQATFDVYDSTASQVYVGLDKIRETSASGYRWGARWEKAVQDTRGQVITYNGVAIPAYYSSSCGGHTESIELSWLKSKAQPYLQGISDLDSSGKPYCQHEKNTSFSWTKSISKSEFLTKLGVTGVANVKVTKRGLSPRLVELKITQKDGTSKVIIVGDSIRTKLGIKSAWIDQMYGLFPDVQMDHWAFNQIEELAGKAIIKGYDNKTFNPTKAVTRGEFSKMLCTALNMISGESTTTFSDMGGHWAEPFITILASRSIISGYSDGTFKPDAQITRAEICTVIARATTLAQSSTSVPFSDVEGHWAKNNIELVASNRIVNGYMGGIFKPDSNATRAEVSAIIFRVLGK